MIEVGSGSTQFTSTSVSISRVVSVNPTALAWSVVYALTQARIVRASELNLYLVHDELIYSWRRLNELAESSTTLDTDRARVIADAEQWESNDRNPGFLYRGAKTRWASDALGNSDSVYDILAREFIEASAARGRLRGRPLVSHALSMATGILGARLVGRRR